jgi:hypothetical protein
VDVFAPRPVESLPASQPDSDSPAFAGAALSRRKLKPAALCFLGFAALVFLIQAISLVTRGAVGDSDIGVFYRTTQLLNDGIGARLYTLHDAKSNWLICIPPAGLALVQPLSFLPPLPATILWALVNIVLAVLAVWALHAFLDSLGERGRLHRAVFPVAAAIFLLLGSGSVQVGQYSVLFAASWIFALWAFSRVARHGSDNATARWAGLAFFLALPTAVKGYPLLLAAAPLLMRGRPGGKRRFLAWSVASLAVFSLIIPLLFYGSRTLELNVSFLQNAIFSPTGRLSTMQGLGSKGNQSLDAICLRYLADDPKFHQRFDYLPHLDWTQAQALKLANVLRLVILLATLGIVLAWRRRGLEFSPYNLLLLMALWSSTLYLMLPETRARYAVYTFLGFMPLLIAALSARRLNRKGEYWLRVVVIAVCFVLILSLMPRLPRVLGLGFLGSLVLWIENLRWIGAQRGQAAREYSRLESG